MSALRLGVADYHRPGSDFAAYHARIKFFDSVAIECPQVLKELRSLNSSTIDAGTSQRILAWARKHFSADLAPPRWIIRTAAMTLHLWSLAPEATGWCHTAAVEFPSVLTDEDCRISINTSWDPSIERRDSAILRIHAQLEERMIEIENAVLRATDETGAPIYQKAREKRNPVHFSWLARFQINDESPESIAASDKLYSVAPGSVKQALRETAKLVGLALRPFPRQAPAGRPRRIAKPRRRVL